MTLLLVCGDNRPVYRKGRGISLVLTSPDITSGCWATTKCITVNRESSCLGTLNSTYSEQAALFLFYRKLWKAKVHVLSVDGRSVRIRRGRSENCEILCYYFHDAWTHLRCLWKQFQSGPKRLFSPFSGTKRHEKSALVTDLWH